MTNLPDRRPLASRDKRWAQELGRWLAATQMTPNQISSASMLAAALAGGAFWISGEVSGWPRVLLLLAAGAFCQLRLLCNLLDGLVAIEACKKELDGAFWNEFPDRVSDILILAGAGLGTDNPALGWAAASMAILTAYAREFGRATGLPPDFSGPMAKQHRMAVMTLAAVTAAVLDVFPVERAPAILAIALWIVSIGAGATALRRARRTVSALRNNAVPQETAAHGQ